MANSSSVFSEFKKQFIKELQIQKTPTPSQFEYGWDDPKKFFTEGYEDRVPFMPGMVASQVGTWHDLVHRAERVDGQRGRKMVADAWENHVIKQKEDPNVVADRIQKLIAEFEMKKMELEQQARMDQARRQFQMEIEKENAVSEEELEAINCSLETTRDMFMAAGYAGTWFSMKDLSGVHRAMAQRLLRHDQLELVKTYKGEGHLINTVYRVKGT